MDYIFCTELKIEPNKIIIGYCYCITKVIALHQILFLKPNPT